MRIAELLQSLSEGQVRYVLAGGLATQRVENRPKDRLDIEAQVRIGRGEDPNA